MNIRQLEIFTTVAATGSMTKAAQQLFLSQPAISKTIRELEQSIGVSLFDRIDNRLSLNNAGRQFRIRATRLLTEFNELAQYGHSDQAQRIPLRLGTSLTIGQELLPTALKHFRQQHPQTPLTCYAENVQQIKNRLLSGEIDLALIEGYEASQSFQAEPLSQYELLIVAAPDFLPTTRLTKQQLLTVPFLLREPGSTLRDIFGMATRQLGVEVVPMLESVNTQVLIQAALAGLGVTILPTPLAQPYLQAGQLVRLILPGQHLTTTNYVVTLKNSPLRELQQELVDCFKAMAGK
ncbi:LysR family transcriptional regulator [Lapidilactobacillus wuchangensis]|uniref:LysR family transcriptional regulator n=1 Tax=Lapidilactobacillus wuchangensis TaxID=2486001 RepID=UPI000F779B9F|nr:LysR family transcriptional regulator [Lapidilactobacillus wuchangensis]